MTMHAECRTPGPQRPRRAAASLLALIVAGLAAPQSASAQPRGTHPVYHDLAPPGAIGSWQVRRNSALAGYMQPVEIKAPLGASISLAAGRTFDPPQPAPRRVALQVGAVYRLAVVNIPLQEGHDVYPTIEIIDRLYPPCGQEARFPIPIELTAHELRLAHEGHFIERVIYVEDAQRPLPASFEGHQPWFDVGQTDDALATADALGRPVAILRIGGRVPSARETDPRFFGSGRPFLSMNKAAPAAAPARGGESHDPLAR